MSKTNDIGVKYTLPQPGEKNSVTYELLPWQIEPWKDTRTVLLLAGAAGSGKALSLGTDIPTVSGFKKMRDISKGDMVFDEYGAPTMVTAVSPIHYPSECYTVNFDSGETIECSGDHLWVYSLARGSSMEYLGTTKEMLQMSKTERVFIKTLPAPVEFRGGDVDLSSNVPPYVMGVMIGDGHMKTASIASSDQEVVDRVSNLVAPFYTVKHYGGYKYNIIRSAPGKHYNIAGFKNLFDSYGLTNTVSSNKFIPKQYKVSHWSRRLELLRGLVDTDGHITKNGVTQYVTISKRLAGDVCELVNGLGVKARISQVNTTYNDHPYVYYRVHWKSQMISAHLSRKKERLKQRVGKVHKWREISSIDQIDVKRMKCIEVANRSGLFLATRGFIPTHNSRLALEKVNALLWKYPMSTALGIRKTRSSLLSSTILNLQRKVLQGVPGVIWRAQPYYRFEYPNGSVWAMGGLADESQREHIRSIGIDGGVDIILIEEASQITRADYQEVITRLRGTATPFNQVILCTNPEAPSHWIYTDLVLPATEVKNHPKIGYYSPRPEDNIYLPDSYIETLKMLKGVQHRRMYLGEWVQSTGIVYDQWVDDVDDEDSNVSHDVDYVPGGGEFVIAIDDGYRGELKNNQWTATSHPAAILFCQKKSNGELHVFDEMYFIEKLPTTYLREVFDYCVEMGYPQPLHMIRDRAAASLGIAGEELGMTVVYNTMTIEESIKEVHRFIAPDDNGVRLLKCNPRCTHLRSEMASYSRNDKTGRPEKSFDHGPDALRYFVWDEVHGTPMSVDTFAWVPEDNKRNNEDNENIGTRDIKKIESSWSGIDIAVI